MCVLFSLCEHINGVTGNYFSSQKVEKLRLLPVSGDDELSSPSQDASGLEEVMEQLNNSFPHSQGTQHQHQH